SEADADRRAKALRPPFRWPQVGLGPVEGPHSARHLAVAREEMFQFAAVQAVGAAHDAPPATSRGSRELSRWWRPGSAGRPHDKRDCEDLTMRVFDPSPEARRLAGATDCGYWKSRPDPSVALPSPCQGFPDSAYRHSRQTMAGDLPTLALK